MGNSINNQEYQKLLNSLQKRSELMDLMHEELRSSCAILKQIVRRLKEASVSSPSVSPSLERMAGTVLLHNMENGQTVILPRKKEPDSSPISDAERIEYLRKKVKGLEALIAFDKEDDYPHM